MNHAIPAFSPQPDLQHSSWSANSPVEPPISWLPCGARCHSSIDMIRLFAEMARQKGKRPAELGHRNLEGRRMTCQQHYHHPHGANY